MTRPGTAGSCAWSVLLRAAAGAGLCGALLGLSGLGGVQAAQRPANQSAAPALRVLKVRDNVFMISGAGGNITVLTFAQGVLMVDTGLPEMADQVLATIRQLSSRPVAHIINTHVHGDHVGGNETIARNGRRIPVDVIASDAAGAPEGPMIVAHENVARGMSVSSGNQPAAPLRAWPTDTYRRESKKLSVNFRGGEAVQLFYEPAAHTDGDSIVWFRHADVIMTGDLFTTTNYPVIDLARGGTINGVVAALNHVLAIAFPAYRSEGGTMIVPGHGRLSDSADVGYYRDMVTIIRDRVQDLINKGMTLDQVKAAKPTRDYDPRYGSTSGTDIFVEAVYKTLGATKK